MKKRYSNRLRKDKINAAVMEAMRKASNHPYVQKRLEEAGIDWLKTYRKGYDMDYLKNEHRLHTFFSVWWSGRSNALETEYGEKQAPKIKDSMKKIYSCKGLLHNHKKKYRCRHPQCPLCYHRKFYKLINDLKPYMRKGGSMHVFRLTEYAEPESMDVMFDGLEARAKRLTREISPYTEQWIRIPHLRYDTEHDCYVISCVFIIVPIERMIKSRLKPVYEKHIENISLRVCGRLDASMDSMPELLTEWLCFDPGVLKVTGCRVFAEWGMNTPWFRYRAKHAHG